VWRVSTEIDGASESFQMRLELTEAAWEWWRYEGNTILLGHRGELDDAEERRNEERCAGL
jgi:hypothetical protein